MGDVTRLVEVLAALSLACDAADGFPAETTVRSALLAAALAAEVAPEVADDVLVGGLLRHIGCTGFAVEEAHRYGAGDDVALRQVMAEVDFGQPERAVATIGRGLPAEAAGVLLGEAAVAGAAHDAAQCDAAEHLAALLPVSAAARSVASDAFERWDGHGGPAGKAGGGISLVARLVEVGYVAELFRHRQGRGGAVAELRLRAGGQLDPTLVEAFLGRSGELFALVDDPRRSPWEELLDRERTPPMTLSPGQLDAVALAFGRFSDLKSVWFAGHAEAVAAVVERAAGGLGFDRATVDLARRAAWLHDLGRAAVPTGTWDAPRALAGPERDRVRFHAWETHRILSAAPLLAPMAAVAGAAHERLDGSGYHRGLSAPGLDDAARLLEAADVFVALGSGRPHRPAMDPASVASVLGEEAAAGRLDRRMVVAVLDAGGDGGGAGGRGSLRPAWPDHLTDREVEVLVLVARGATNKDVARTLGITAKTVAHHVAHVYTKTGVRSRAGASLYALERGLL